MLAGAWRNLYRPQAPDVFSRCQGMQVLSCWSRDDRTFLLDLLPLKHSLRGRETAAVRNYKQIY